MPIYLFLSLYQIGCILHSIRSSMAAGCLFVCSILYCKILVLTFSFTSLKPRTINLNGSVLSCAAKWDRKLYLRKNTGLAHKSKLKGISVDIWTTSMLNITKNALLAMYFVSLAGDISPNPAPIDVLKASSAGNGISFWYGNAQNLTDTKFEETSSLLGTQDNRNRAEIILTEAFLTNKKPNSIYSTPGYDLYWRNILLMHVNNRLT